MDDMRNNLDSKQRSASDIGSGSRTYGMRINADSCMDTDVHTAVGSAHKAELKASPDVAVFSQYAAAWASLDLRSNGWRFRHAQ